MKNHQKFQKIAFISLIFIFIAVISISIAVLISRIGKIAVQVKYAPYSATIKLNGVTISNNSTNYLSPGNYTLTAELDHFESISESVTIDDSTEYLLGQLLPTDQEGESIATAHQSEYSEVEGIFGQLSNEAGAVIKEEYPILNHLPINNNFYSISFRYDSDTPGKPLITVKAEPLYLDIATQKLLSFKDVNPAEYDISFTAENPFKSPQESFAQDPKEFLTQTFPIISSDFKIGDNQASDDYYLVTVYQYDYNNDTNYNHYRIALKRNGNSWSLVATPQPLLTTYNTPELSLDLLSRANQLQ